MGGRQRRTHRTPRQKSGTNLSVNVEADPRRWIANHIGSCFRYLAQIPSRDDRKKHNRIALGLIATVVFALGPLGYSLMELHPCGAWFCWVVALLCGGYSFWSIASGARWIRIAILVVATSVFAFYAHRWVYFYTELDSFFVNPGVFIVEGSGDWLLLVTSQNTHRPLSSVHMILQDIVTAHAIPNERDPAIREAMIRGGTIEKFYPEIGPTTLTDPIRWRPIDVNNQEYSIQARYRIGERVFFSTEEIRIVNIGTKFISAERMTEAPVWQFSVTVRNQSGKILMHCVSPKFPHDARWVAGPACLPGPNYAPLPRSLCARCFSDGFELFASP
jgi:hypothetical protein